MELTYSLEFVNNTAANSTEVVIGVKLLWRRMLAVNNNLAVDAVPTSETIAERTFTFAASSDRTTWRTQIRQWARQAVQTHKQQRASAIAADQFIDTEQRAVVNLET